MTWTSILSAINNGNISQLSSWQLWLLLCLYYYANNQVVFKILRNLSVFQYISTGLPETLPSDCDLE